MPFYTYYCPKCDSIKDDILHGMNEKPEILCDECKTEMRIKIHAVNFSMGHSSTRGISGTNQDILRHQDLKIHLQNNHQRYC